MFQFIAVLILTDNQVVPFLAKGASSTWLLNSVDITLVVLELFPSCPRSRNSQVSLEP